MCFDFPLFVVQQHLYTLQKSVFSNHQPILLAKDYAQQLQTISFQNQFYYCYISTQSTLMVFLYPHTLCLALHLPYSPKQMHLHIIEQQLFLTCWYKTEQYQMQQINILKNTLKNAYFPKNLTPLTCTPLSNGFLMFSYQSENGTISFGYWDDNLSWHFLCAQSDYESKIRELQVAFSESQNSLKNIYENKINQLQQQIKSATTQYNELMRVAQAYKNEVLKRNKKY